MVEKLKFVAFMILGLLCCAPFIAGYVGIGLWLDGTAWFWPWMATFLLSMPTYVVFVMAPVLERVERWL